MAACLAYTIYNDFSLIEPEWKELQESGACYVFQTFEWCTCWYNTMGRRNGVKPCLVSVRADTKIIMIVPLGIWAESGITWLRFIAPRISDYRCALLSRDFAAVVQGQGFHDVWENIVRLLPRVDIIELTHMPADIDGTANPFLQLNRVTQSNVAHSAKLPSTFEEFTANRRAHFFRDTRRKRRRLAEAGNIGFQVHHGSTLNAVMDVLALQKGRRWMASAGESFFDTCAGLLDFYKTLGGLSFDGGCGHVSSLAVDGRIVATHLGLVFKDRFYSLLPAYAAGAWTRYSPGRTLMENLVRNCISDGMKTFDLTVGDEPYKRDWADNSLALYEHRRGLTWRGSAFLAVLAAKRKLRGALKQIGRLRKFVARVRSARWSKKVAGREDAVELNLDA